MLVYLRDGSAQFTCCHTEIKVADPTFYITQSQYTDTGPTSPSADPIMPGAWQGSHWSANFEVTGMTRPGKIPSQPGFEPRIFRCRIRSQIATASVSQLDSYQATALTRAARHRHVVNVPHHLDTTPRDAVLWSSLSVGSDDYCRCSYPL